MLYDPMIAMEVCCAMLPTATLRGTHKVSSEYAVIQGNAPAAKLSSSQGIL